MNEDIVLTLTKRRSIYSLSKDLPVSEQRIEELAAHAAIYSPSAFNSQTPRLVVLFGKEHEALWDIVRETLRLTVSEEQFVQTEERIASYAAAYGTVLFFEESADTEALARQFPVFEHNFTVWAQHANGMVQYALWNLFAQEGVGASLQHYNPLIDDQVRRRWHLPDSWMLVAQMPFGGIAAPAGEKTVKPIGERMRVFR